MKKLTFISLISFLLFISATVVVGDVFPDMEGEKLDGTKISLPEDTKGKFTLIALAYSKKAESDLETWYEPIYKKFIAKPEPNGFFSFEPYDINLYFVPMFTGVKQSAAGGAKKKMKEEIDAKFHDYFLVFSGKLADYKESLGLKKKDEPYFFLLNEEGEIVYQTSGAFSSSKLDSIEDEIEPAE